MPPAKPTQVYSEAEQHLADCDPIMRQLIADHGPGLSRAMPHGFASLVRIIVGQQLSTIVAARIYDRLREACGGRITPAAIERLSDAKLRSAGLSQAKTNSLRDLAEKTRTRKVRFNRVTSMSDEQIAEMLIQVKGVGPWSIQMYLMFVLGRLDIFAPGDKGIQTAIARLYKKRNLKKLEAFAKRWKPFRTVACWYLWRSLHNTPVTKAP